MDKEKKREREKKKKKKKHPKEQVLTDGLSERYVDMTPRSVEHVTCEWGKKKTGGIYGITVS